MNLWSMINLENGNQGVNKKISVSKCFWLVSLEEIRVYSGVIVH